jgi:hypothetical protein
MRKYIFKRLKLLSFTIFPLLIPALLYADSSGLLKEKWSYQIEGEIGITERTYLLVYGDDATNLKKIHVVSKCQKIISSESTYGECTHQISLSSNKKKYTLKTGEDVVLVKSPTDILLIGTLNYGCCAGPDYIEIYTKNGAYLGIIEGFNLSKRANRNNILERLFDLRNTARNFMLIQQQNSFNFEAIAFKNDGSSQKISVQVDIKGKDKCDYWHIEDFVQYGDVKDITLNVSGFFCHANIPEEQSFLCKPKNNIIECFLKKTQ